MSMHMIKGVQIHGKSTKKGRRKLTQKQLSDMEVSWRQHNKAMRRKHMHDLQFKEFNDYLSYVFGEYKPKKKEFKPYVPQQSYVRNPTHYPSAPALKTSDTVPGSGRLKENPKYTGDLIVGIGTMHKSNAVPIMRGTEQAKDIANMRR